MKSAKVFFDLVAASAGMDFSALLDEIPDFGTEPSEPVRRYYANEIALAGSYGRLGLTIPRAISTITPVCYCEEMLSLALKARLLATPSHIAYATTKYPRDQDEAYFGKVITNPHTSLAQVVGWLTLTTCTSRTSGSWSRWILDRRTWRKSQTRRVRN